MGSSIAALSKEIALIWQAGLSAIVWGPPGIGKSASIKALAGKQKFTVPRNDSVAACSQRLAAVYGAEHTGRPVFDVRLVLCAPNDLKGIPVYDTEDKKAVWVMSGMFPTSADRLASMERMLVGLTEVPHDERQPSHSARVATLESEIHSALLAQHGVIFLDEITQAPPAVQAAAFSLVLDRTINEYRVPKWVDIVAASNRLNDGSMTNKMPTALRSRFVHLEVDTPNLDEFEEYAFTAGFEPDVIGYLRFHPDHLFKFDPRNLRGENAEMAEITFPCPRSWEFASRLIKGARSMKSEDDTLERVLAGAVGNGAAIQFIAWRGLYRKLPDCELVLRGELRRRDISFTRKDQTTGEDVNDMSMEYTYIMECFQRVLALDCAPETEQATSRIDNFLRFTLDSTNSSVDWGALIFKKVHNSDNKIALAMKKRPAFREIATTMLKDGTLFA